MSTPSPPTSAAGTVQTAPRPQAVGSRGAEGYPEGAGESPVGQTPHPGQWDLPLRPEAPGHRILTEPPAVSRPPVFTLFLNFPGAWRVAWV